MQLLVSVRDAGEARRAWAAGAGIVDAKEPGHGALGAVAPDVLMAIAAALPAEAPFSAALGEGDGDAMIAAIEATPILPGRRQWFAKFALAGEPHAAASTALESAIRCLAARADTPRLVFARYADLGRDGLAEWMGIAASAGVWGVLLDTAQKDGRSLLDAMDVPSLTAAAALASRYGLRLAVAGSLCVAHLDAIASTGAGIMGVRGAVCRGGRGGTLQEERVALLRARLDAISGRPAPGRLQASAT